MYCHWSQTRQWRTRWCYCYRHKRQFPVDLEGTTPSPQGIGVYGDNSSTTGFAIGVFGTNDSTSGIGVLGAANATTGAAFGMKGTSASSAGVGVYGVATPTLPGNPPRA